MPIALSCVCGRSIPVKDDFAGHNIKCPGCGAVLAVPTPEPPQPAAEAFDDLEVVSAEADAEGAKASEDEDEEELSLRERVRRREERAEEGEQEERDRRRSKRRKERALNALVEKGRFREKGSRGYLTNLNPGTGAGVVMLVLGLACAMLFLFCAGRVSGRGGTIIFVPGAGLIVGGIAAISRGMSGRR